MSNSLQLSNINSLFIGEMRMKLLSLRSFGIITLLLFSSALWAEEIEVKSFQKKRSPALRPAGAVPSAPAPELEPALPAENVIARAGAAYPQVDTLTQLAFNLVMQARRVQSFVERLNSSLFFIAENENRELYSDFLYKERLDKKTWTNHDMKTNLTIIYELDGSADSLFSTLQAASDYARIADADWMILKAKENSPFATVEKVISGDPDPKKKILGLKARQQAVSANVSTMCTEIETILDANPGVKATQARAILKTLRGGAVTVLENVVDEFIAVSKNPDHIVKYPIKIGNDYFNYSGFTTK
jgi:hypothetical protein